MFRRVSFLGSTPVVLTVSAVAAILASRRCPRLAIAIVVIALARPLAEWTLKELVSRDRPIGDRMVRGEGYSFPSGHPLATAASWGVLPLVVALYTKRRLVWWAVAVGVWTMAVLVALSRVWLGVHWASDVVAGLVLAVLGVAGGRAVHRRDARRLLVNAAVSNATTSTKRWSIVQSSMQPRSWRRSVSVEGRLEHDPEPPVALVADRSGDVGGDLQPAGEQQRFHHLVERLAAFAALGAGPDDDLDLRVRIDATVGRQRRLAQRPHAEDADGETDRAEGDVGGLGRHVRPARRSSLRIWASSAPGTSWASTVTSSTTSPPRG